MVPYIAPTPNFTRRMSELRTPFYYRFIVSSLVVLDKQKPPNGWFFVCFAKCNPASASGRRVCSLGRGAARRRQKRNDPLCKAGHRHRLQPDLAGSGQAGMQQAFAAEENVLKALDHRDFVLHARFICRDVARINDQGFAGRKRFFADRAVDF